MEPHPHLRRLLGYDDAEWRPRSLKFSGWAFTVDRLAAASPRILAVGIGAPQVVPFLAEDRSSFIEWLAGQDHEWLMRLPETEHHISEAAEPLGLPGVVTVLAHVGPLLDRFGDLGMDASSAPDGSSGIVVDVVALANRLYHLWSALVTAVWNPEFPRSDEFSTGLQARLEEQEPGILTELAALYPRSEDFTRAVERLAILAANPAPARYLASPSGLDGPHSLPPGPVSPLQDVFFVIAASAGAIVPPYPVPRLFVCSYQPCRKLFVSNKLGVGGKLRFCSPRHGKSYYAARRVREKAELSKRAKSSEE